MKIACFDMEGTLTPEIWEQVASDTGVDEFNKTTRDIPNYSELMDFRLALMKELSLKISDIQGSIHKMQPLDGAVDFLNEIRKDYQVVILSDTFHEFAESLMEKLGYPLLLCHQLIINSDGSIDGYKLRHQKAKKQAILAFQEIGYDCIAAGDSYNDIQMFEVARQGFFINAPKKISSEFSSYQSYDNYSDLLEAFKGLI